MSSSLFKSLFSCCKHPPSIQPPTLIDTYPRTYSSNSSSSVISSSNIPSINLSSSRKANSFNISSSQPSPSPNAPSHLFPALFHSPNKTVSKIQPLTITDLEYYYDSLFPTDTSPNSAVPSSFEYLPIQSTPEGDFIGENIIISDEEIKNNLTLTLTGANHGTSSDIFNCNTYVINAAGELHSLRKKRDGYTIFGINPSKANTTSHSFTNNVPIKISSQTTNTKSVVLEDKIQHQNNQIDIIINFTAKITTPRVFAIHFNRKDSHYYLCNLNTNIKVNTYVMQVKINNGYLLSQNTINHFVVGDVLLSATVGNMVGLLELKVYCDKHNKTKMKVYNFNKKDQSLITIGRYGCSINVDNANLAQVHCSVYFNKYTNCWCVVDGDGKGHKSGIGVWIIVKEGQRFKFENKSKWEYLVKIGMQMFSVYFDNT